MIIEIKSETGSLPIAKLFNSDSKRTLNFASKAIHSWAINKINIQPIPGTNWKSLKTGEEYAMQHRIQLMSDDYPVDIIIEMIIDDQEIVIDLDIGGVVTRTIKYEGIATVEGMLGNTPVMGPAFVEMQPVGALK